MNISLPEPLKQWVDEQVSEGGYGTASEFVREVLRKERAQRLRAQIDAKLLEALNSGDSTPMTRQDWEEIRKEALKRLAGDQG